MAWTRERAADWGRRNGLLVGCNYTPAYAGNQIEFWSAQTFRPLAIARELDLAQSLGFNAVRVYLHDLCFMEDGPDFLARVDQFIGLAAERRIATLPVIFDSVWHPEPRAGPQPEPRPGVIGPSWVQSPGVPVLRAPLKFAELEGYVTALVTRFRLDPRVLAWDVWNEPDNDNALAYGDRDLGAAKADVVAPLLARVIDWVRACEPMQPLTCAVWRGSFDDAGLTPLARLMLEQSDVISFHCYEPPDTLEKAILSLTRFGRPLLCTEYMARPRGSTFAACLPVLARHGVGALNWGLVNGRTQCHYAWDSWAAPVAGEPPLWFHDIYRADHTPYDPAEVAAIRAVTGIAQEP